MSPRWPQARSHPALHSCSRRGSAARGLASCPSPRARARASSAQPSWCFLLQALRNSSAARTSSRRTPTPSCRRLPRSSQAAGLPAVHDFSNAEGLAAASSRIARIMGAIYRDSVVRGQLPDVHRLVAYLSGNRSVLWKEAVERAPDVILGVQVGGDPAEGQPAPASPRIPEQVLAQLAHRGQLGLTRAQIVVQVPAVHALRRRAARGPQARPPRGGPPPRPAPAGARRACRRWPSARAAGWCRATPRGSPPEGFRRARARA